MPKRENIPLCLRAALHYASPELTCFGWKVFPIRIEVTKSGAIKKYSWLSAKHAPGGENWGMTNDLEQLEKNFNNPRWRLKCGVGLPTGADNEVIVVEYDTIKGHGVDGKASIKTLEKTHGKLPNTLMSQSPSGSVHRFYKHPGGIKLKSMSIAAGVDVKADGGMVVLPPSVRPDGKYKWLNDKPIADAPQWLIDMITDEAAKTNGHDPDDPWDESLYEPLSEAEIAEGCELIAAHLPNKGKDGSGDSWDDWNTVGMKIFFTAPDERGFAAFDGYSQRSDKYDASATKEKWSKYFTSPPDKVTTGSFNYLVRESQPDYEAEEWTTKPKQKTNEQAPKADAPAPADLWDSFYSPPLPPGLLPKTIEEFAFAFGKQIGCDPAGLAMGTLTACAAVIPDRIKVQPLKHSTWKQPARMWVALVGAASVKKTPIYSEVMDPINFIDKKLVQEYMKKKEEYDQLEPAEKKKTPPPVCVRLKIEDITIEKAQEVFVDNPMGLFMARNELAGWFGSMDKYSGGKGSHTDRGFWLATYDGHGHTFDRVKRGTHHVDNLGLSLLGGIQPSVIRKISNIGEDDGLIERVNPIVCRDGTVSLDLPVPKEAAAYAKLINDLYALRKTHSDEVLNFSDEARVIREGVERYYQDMLNLFQPTYSMFASHLGKYHGMFVRMCLLWHMIEHHGDAWTTDIDAETAQRVATFMREFLMRHAAAFYYGVLDVGDEQDRIRAIGSYILAHKPASISGRDVQRGTNSAKGLKRKDIEGLFEQLHALGWLVRPFAAKNARAGDPPHWQVNQAVHGFSERAQIETTRREKLREHLLDLRTKPMTQEKGKRGFH